MSIFKVIFQTEIKPWILTKDLHAFWLKLITTDIRLAIRCFMYVVYTNIHIISKFVILNYLKHLLEHNCLEYHNATLNILPCIHTCNLLNRTRLQYSKNRRKMKNSLAKQTPK